jgi:hypothetical protein
MGNGNLQMGGAGGAQSGSPVKESSFLNHETTAEEIEGDEKKLSRMAQSISPPPSNGGIPIRR